MKKTSIQVLLIALLTVLALTVDIDPNYSFDDFVRDYHRTYEGEEKAAHAAAFKKNFANILRYKR